MGANDTSFQCDGSNSTFRVMFKEPVEILPNTSYTACSTLKVHCIVKKLTVKVLKIWTFRKFAIIVLKFEQLGFTIENHVQKLWIEWHTMKTRIRLLLAVSPGSALFTQTCLLKTKDHYSTNHLSWETTNYIRYEPRHDKTCPHGFATM